MPMYESLPIRVTLTVEVDDHVLTFEEIGKATGARYHGVDPRESGRSTSDSLESGIRGGVDIHMALVAERMRAFLARAYPAVRAYPAAEKNAAG